MRCVGGADIVPSKIPASVLLRQLQEQQLQQQAKAATNGLLPLYSSPPALLPPLPFRSVTVCELAGYATAKPEAADVKPEGLVKSEADGMAPVQAETDGNAPLKEEADGEVQATGTSTAEAAEQPTAATSMVPSHPAHVANGEAVKVEAAKIGQPAAAEVSAAPLNIDGS